MDNFSRVWLLLIKHADFLTIARPNRFHQLLFLFSRYSKHIEIWSLSNSENNNSGHPTPRLDPQDQPKKLVKIQKVTKNRENKNEAEGIICSCISDNGKFVFLATNSGFRLYVLRVVSFWGQITKKHELYA